MPSFTFFFLMVIAGFLIVDHWMRDKKHWQRLSTVFVVVAVLIGSITAYGEFTFNFFVKDNAMLEPWNAFHYYLNAKYFKELGYFDAYTCAYQADQQGKKMFDDPTILVRDLSTYKEYPKQDLPPCPAGRFTPERWQAFSQDLTWLESQNVALPASYGKDIRLYWNNMLFDKGYNLPPPFVVISQFFVNIAPIRGATFPFLLFWMDTVVAALTFLLMLRWKGARVTGLFFLAYLFFFGAYRELFGLFLQNVWFFCVTLSLLFWERKWTKMSAVALAFAGIMRIFPFFFAFGPLVLLAQSIVQKKKIEHSPLLSWMLTLGVATTILLILGNFTGHGFAVWGEFYHKMHVHSTYIRREWFDIGWQNFLTTLGWINGWSIPQALFPISVMAGLVLFVRVCLRRSFIESFVLGLIPVYLLVDLSPFYYFILGFPLLFLEKKTDFPWKKMGAGVFVLLALHHLLGWVGPEYTYDLLVGQPIAELLLMMFLVTMSVLAVRAPRITQNIDAVAEVTAGANS